MPGKAVGRAAVELPWLCPNTDSLIALAEAPATASGLSATDPALAIFLLRFAPAAPPPDAFALAPGSLLSAILPDTAASFLDATATGVLTTSSDPLRQVLMVAQRAGAVAALLAETTRLVPCEVAATTARLSPLGWYAIAAVDHSAGVNPLADCRFSTCPAEVQSDLWGLDQGAIARRLAARWRLPLWVATTIGSLTMPLRVAMALVTNPDLFAIVQLAILEAEGEGIRLGLTQGADRSELIEHLGLNDRALEAILRQEQEPTSRQPISGLDPNPHKVPLVRNVLRLAAESRRRNGPGLVARLEERIDGLHGAVADLGEQVGERLRSAKLAGLAELAAGAGHEINNPLAVISGNAQRLLRTEQDADRGDSLRAIVRQTQRIAGILRDLMQFARPPRPEPRAFPVVEVLQGVREDLAALATDRGVLLELGAALPGVWCDGDPTQLRHALGAVVRNAIEAAPAGGWVRTSCTAMDDGPVVIVVEDSGPGLTPEVAEHAFDPFFCGRSAGRGRGLGLPTAWQLARQNGGELRFDPIEGVPARFVLTLPRASSHDLLTLRSA